MPAPALIKKIGIDFKKCDFQTSKYFGKGNRKGLSISSFTLLVKRMSYSKHEIDPKAISI